MKGLLIRNQVFPLHKCFSGHLKCLQLRMFWIQRGQKTWFLTILLALALLPTLAMAAPSLSPNETNLTLQNPTVRIDPAESVVGAGQTFTVSVTIDEADDLGGFEFTLLFVTTTVKVDSVTLGDFLGSTGRTVGLVGPIIDNQAGRVSFGAWTAGSAPGPNGTGALALITLTTQGAGISPLDLQGVLVLDTKAEHQTPTVEDGTVVAGGAPTPTPTPTATSTPTGTTTPTPTTTTTTTTTPEPVIVVHPTSAPVGETFTFTGSHFTPDGLIKEWFADPDQARHLLGSFYADSSGGFNRQHNWEKYWPAGTYSFIANDVTKGSETSVEFEMTESQPHTPTSTPTSTPTATPTSFSRKIYLPLVLKGW